jgi:tetratricopeptide (TPR) repeat protein
MDTAAHPALNVSRLQKDEARLMAILVKEPGNAGALAGMGWIRSQQGNFLGAISFLEQARLKRPGDHALAVAIELARFRFLMSEAQNSLASNDLPTAEKRYLSALEIRPHNREAFAGLHVTLLRARQPAVGQPPASIPLARP